MRRKTKMEEGMMRRKTEEDGGGDYKKEDRGRWRRGL